MKENIISNGINRKTFLFFIVVFLFVANTINLIIKTMITKGEISNIWSIVAILFLSSILAFFVNLRFKNANRKSTLAVVCSFIPPLVLAPIIAGLYYKPFDDRHNIKKTLNKNHIEIKTIWFYIKQIFIIFYLFLGILLFVFPPQANSIYQRNFLFFTEVHKVDLSFFIYSVAAYFFIGLILYFLLNINKLLRR